ncbi:MAG: BON domain-containing protein [Chloroflexi bacterium]|nr:BON domain-containing protein [Chloroflexota bacterium]
MRTLFGFLIGFGAGVIGIRRAKADLEASTDGGQTGWRRRLRNLGKTGTVDPGGDEGIRDRVEAEWKRLGLIQPRVDATMIDGALYVRGEARSSTADALVATARPIPGVQEVVDEIKRS